MNDRDLRDAFSALRESTSGDSPEAADTLERVLASSVKTKRRRLRLLKLWVPLAAALVGSTAWAAASGKLPMWSAGDEAPPPVAPTAVAAAPAAPKGGRLPADTTMTVPSSFESARAEVPVAVAPPATPTPPTAAVHAPVAPQPAQPPTPAPAASAASARSALAEDKADYEAAYRVHGSAKPNDPAAAKAAVAAWDGYLAKHPKGRFVPEAKYARAVALARAGNRDEAKEALRSFAEGEQGDYRRDDARELLDAMKKK
jgi:hypothetical protein